MIDCWNTVISCQNEAYHKVIPSNEAFKIVIKGTIKIRLFEVLSAL